MIVDWPPVVELFYAPKLQLLSTGDPTLES